MKALLIAAAFAAAPLLPAQAQAHHGEMVAASVDPGFSQDPAIERGEPFAIRACGDVGGAYTDVCFNETIKVGIAGKALPVLSLGFDKEFTRTRRVNCERNYREGSVFNAVAIEYCPGAADGSLAPAPFL